MELIEQLAEAALQRDSLRLRSLVQDLTRAGINWSSIPRPTTNDMRLLAIAASLAELLATRQNQVPPMWTKEIGALKEPFLTAKCCHLSLEAMAKKGLFTN